VATLRFYSSRPVVLGGDEIKTKGLKFIALFRVLPRTFDRVLIRHIFVSLCIQP
jgi:hypothetical protein